jgi:hypothetical protein
VPEEAELAGYAIHGEKRSVGGSSSAAQHTAEQSLKSCLALQAVVFEVELTSYVIKRQVKRKLRQVGGSSFAVRQLLSHSKNGVQRLPR